MSQNRKNIESEYKSYNAFRDNFRLSSSMMDEFKRFAEEKGVALVSSDFDRDKDFIEISIKSQIARDLWGNEGSYAVFVSTDEQFLKAITLFEQAKDLSKLGK